MSLFPTRLRPRSVTYAKLQNVSAADKLLGRATDGAGGVEEIDCTAAGRDLLAAADAAAQRTALGLAIGTNVQAYDVQLTSLSGLSYTGNALKVVRVNAGESGFELATLSGDGLGPDGDKGDITVGGSGTTLTIDNDVVTFAKMQNATQACFIGATGAGNFEERTYANVRSDLGLVIGTNVQAFDAQLSSLAGLSYAGNANKYIRVNAGETDFELATVTGGSGLTAAKVGARTVGGL